MVGSVGRAAVPSRQRPYKLDHIIWAVPDLEAACQRIHALTGIEPQSGGVLPGRTQSHNALLSLGNGSYLEILCPARTGTAKWANYVEDGNSHVIGYAMTVKDRFSHLLAALASARLKPNGPRPFGRVRPDGTKLNWELVHITGTEFDNAMPFFIDWLDSKPHPSVSSPGGIKLSSFAISHPRAKELQNSFKMLSIDTPVVASDRHYMEVTLQTPKGEVRLI